MGNTLPMATAADVIFVDGIVETVTGVTAEAVAVVGGRIVAVGSTDAVARLRTGSTEIVDLAGRALLPGLVEPHSHPDMAGFLYSWVDVSGFRHPHVADVERVLHAAIDAADPGEWVFAFGLDPMLTADIGVWGRDRLDAMAPAVPVAVLMQSMHTLFVNSTALSRVGIDESTPQPSGGGRFGKDSTGRLTGKIEEQSAMAPFLAHALSVPTPMRDLIVDEYRTCASVGITTMGMAGSMPGSDELCRALADDPATPLRLVSYVGHGRALKTGRRPEFDHDRFRIAGAKLWYDGSPYTGTMYLDDPYLESNLCCCTLGIPEGSRGRPNFTPGDLLEVLRTLHADGWQVLTHSQGDRACREMIGLYAQVLDGADDHRWRVEHCALISAEELHRSSEIGVSPSFHVDHIRWYGPELVDDIIGAERGERLMPIRTAIDAGLRPSLHADSPMYPPGPLRLASTAVNRRTRLGTTIAPHLAVTALEALRAVTIDAAWQLGLDDEVGSIEVGKRADFAIVDRSPLRCDPLDIDQLDVESTWLDGAEVWSLS